MNTYNLKTLKVSEDMLLFNEKDSFHFYITPGGYHWWVRIPWTKVIVL